MSTMHWGYLDAGNLAGIYYEQSQLDMAILHYKQAINCDSTFIEAYNNLGNALKDAGHALKDAGHYRSCFALQPNHPQALSSLSNIYMDCNMMSVAASFYKATLAVTTGISAPFNNLAIIYKQQTAADGLVNRGNTFKEIGRVTEAIQDYIRAVNIIPTMPEAHANLASAYKDNLQISSTPELKLMKCDLSLQGTGIAMASGQMQDPDRNGPEDESASRLSHPTPSYPLSEAEA
ncbi:hypothetical protein ZIOFF_072261 [Zingiber officinale]|uniref:Uncharacterized protein n=1 Tax=Zingiber officinale TaxID=94328 RepID=A0A8J5C2M7_ZINOF|nr:hypothetical protein ZIOFF_072261 [Zingiber officinale]